MIAVFTILLFFVIVNILSNSIAQNVGAARVVIDQPTREYLEDPGMVVDGQAARVTVGDRERVGGWVA